MPDDMTAPAGQQSSFEDLRRLNQHGAEYWSVRDLQHLLGYSQWRRFEEAIQRAITSCRQSGNAPDNHFAGAGKMVPLGSGSEREIPDFHLSRFACYLIAQDGDPRKPAIAEAQKYFAIQTRRQELSDDDARDLEDLELRDQARQEFKALSGAAQDAGVNSRSFGVFHDAGYKGLYGGLGVDDIKRRKGIPNKENLMDRMDTTERAANQFRMTQTRDKLQRERIRGEQKAIETHNSVGREVRAAIARIGGTPPERIPPADHIKKVKKLLKGATPRIQLDPEDAGGLAGDQGSGTVRKRLGCARHTETRNQHWSSARTPIRRLHHEHATPSHCIAGSQFGGDGGGAGTVRAGGGRGHPGGGAGALV